MKFNLTPAQEDDFLEAILPCKSPEEYQRVLVAFGRQHNRSAAVALEEGENWLRRRAKRRSDYWRWLAVGWPGLNERPRVIRSNLSFTWVEHKILQWAKEWKNEGKEWPSPAYLAQLLGRTEAEILIEQERQQTTRFGFEGLF